MDQDEQVLHQFEYNIPNDNDDHYNMNYQNLLILVEAYKKYDLRNYLKRKRNLYTNSKPEGDTRPDHVVSYFNALEFLPVTRPSNALSNVFIH